MRVLVLGGCGFIGSHLVDRLLAAGQRVRVLDRNPETLRSPLPQVEYMLGEYGDSNIIVEALADIDLVIHLVSATVPVTAAINPHADVTGNLVPTIDLLENMRKCKVRRIVFLSSGGTVYGIPDQIPTPESHPLRPISSYGIVKVAIEHYIQMYGAGDGLSTTIIRPSNPYGPRQRHTGVQGVVATFLNNIRHDEALSVWGDGNIIRDYIYIDDLADLVIKAIMLDAPGIYNAGSGNGISINELIDTLMLVTGRTIKVEYSSPRFVDVQKSVLDIGNAGKCLGWSPRISFHEGVERYWNWMIN